MKETQPTEILSLLNKLCDEVSHELDDTKQRIIHPMLEINLILAIKQLNFLKKDIEDINKRFSSLNVEEAVREISRLPKIGYSIGQTFYGGLKFITGAASILTVHGASKGVRVAERWLDKTVEGVSNLYTEITTLIKESHIIKEVCQNFINLFKKEDNAAYFNNLLEELHFYSHNTYQYLVTLIFDLKKIEDKREETQLLLILFKYGTLKQALLTFQHYYNQEDENKKHQVTEIFRGWFLFIKENKSLLYDSSDKKVEKINEWFSESLKQGTKWEKTPAEIKELINPAGKIEVLPNSQRNSFFKSSVSTAHLPSPPPPPKDSPPIALRKSAEVTRRQLALSERAKAFCPKWDEGMELAQGEVRPLIRNLLLAKYEKEAEM